jgi:DNA-directed RNA polymerase subunit RPC12/RpoP
MPAGKERAREPPAARRRGVIRCPQCRSHRLSHEMAFIGGAKYYCADCGFRGALVVTDDGEEPAGAPR